jgi:hypothetical protein
MGLKLSGISNEDVDKIYWQYNKLLRYIPCASLAYLLFSNDSIPYEILLTMPLPRRKYSLFLIIMGSNAVEVFP